MSGRRERARLLVALFGLVIASAGGGCGIRLGRPGPIHYEDHEGQTEYPLTIDSAYSMAVPVKRGAPYTASLVLLTTHRDTVARIVAVRPVRKSPNLQIVGTAQAGPDRHFGLANGAHGFPPADLPKPAQTRYRPLAGTTLGPGRPAQRQGTDVLLGVRLTSGVRAWFDGIEVEYTVGDQTYIGRFPVAWAMCTTWECTAPEIGPPWGPA
jgi:hypothetical protein